ncbi:uncharacterized protein C8A04DRAFT_26473 [Dichotomopilus funicola]|uniref:Fe2OG dioxygenase domain-containing protein n=1 Tax=Dichotomopilus funicola TaxID=1934379 RepID=A0AAN6V6C9_9PEZI|nr:hypothetical protein C8A04DRAFT_26473 [Dichotomopilus funicola]
MDPTTNEAVVSEASAPATGRGPRRPAFQNSLEKTKRFYEDLETDPSKTPKRQRTQPRPATKVGSIRKKTSRKRNAGLNGTPRTPLAIEDTGSLSVDLSLPMTPSTTSTEGSDDHEATQTGTSSAEHGHEVVQIDTPSTGHDDEVTRPGTSSAEHDHEVAQTDTPLPEHDDGTAQTDIPSADEALDKCIKSTRVKASNTGDGSVERSGLPSIGQPLIWAEKRGGLCEALDYYKSYKSGLYTRKAVGALGFLMDSEVEPRDVFGTQVIISSMGGGRRKSPNGEGMIRDQDASDDKGGINAIRKTHQEKGLVAVIAGESHSLYPCKPPHAYCVLAYFHITDVWKEKQVTKSGKIVAVWRIRFEKADLDEPSWWRPMQDGVAEPEAYDLLTKTPVSTCNACNAPSKEIFTSGWACLNNKCEQYFIFPEGPVEDINSLAYTSVFLNERTPFVGRIPSLFPEPLDLTNLHGTEGTCRNGFVCRECGCACRRLYWNRLKCENTSCTYEEEAVMRPYPGHMLRNENRRFDASLRRSNQKISFDMKVDVTTLEASDFPRELAAPQTPFQLGQTLRLGDFEVSQYYLPGPDGRIIGSFSIFSANDAINSRVDGPDDLFRRLELLDLGLCRNPSAIAGHKLEGLTRHFQQNFGARYKFGVQVQSRGFSGAPDEILRALHRLIWAKKAAIEQSNAFISSLDPQLVGDNAVIPIEDDFDFNELLALGYMENDSISYHDDGEKELGPAVAALSLGSPSSMNFRPKNIAKYNHRTRQYRRKVCYTDVLSVPMKHGDMMVMAGRDIQAAYEHAVVPKGNRRFSLTARYIDPMRIADLDDRADAYSKGAIPEHAQSFAYDGF